MIRNIAVLAVHIIYSLSIFCQNSPQTVKCATLEADSLLRAAYPELGERADFESWLEEKIAARNNSVTEGSIVLTIPVIVHVIHNGELVGNGTNISADQIYSQLDVLNEDYRRIAGTPGHNTHPNGADIEIEFCPATIDPDSNALAEPGIHRVNRTDIGANSPPYTVSYTKNNIQPQTYWNPDQYMNIWTVDLANDFLGYAQLPNSSTLPDLSVNYGPAKTDGVVIRPTSFGRVGNVDPPYDHGRTTTHEVGHWLGLWHIWGDGGCSVDDYCTDTPGSDGPNYGCPTAPVSCGSTDMVANYMDYTDDVCMNIFTNCQKTRMRTVMDNSPRRGILASSTTCSAEIAPNANFSASVVEVCEGGMISFSDLSNNSPSSWNWSFPGGTPSSSTQANPKITYTSEGTYDVLLVSTNAFGSDSIFKEDFIVVYSSGPNVFFSQSFEEGLGDWTIENPDNNITWEVKDVSGTVAGSKAIGISLYDYAVVGERDAIISPIIDFRANSAITLRFNHAHRRFSNNESDSLIVYASIDGGATYPYIIYHDAENGTGNFATNENIFSSFTPSGNDDWCYSGSGWAECVMLDLSQFDGEEFFRLKFESVNDYGNNIYIDEIALSGVCRAFVGIEPPVDTRPKWAVFPNPGEGFFTISIEDVPATNLTVEVFNIQGQRLYQQYNLPAAGAFTHNVDLTGRPSGTYFVRVISEKFEIHRKILIR